MMRIKRAVNGRVEPKTFTYTTAVITYRAGYNIYIFYKKPMRYFYRVIETGNIFFLGKKKNFFYDPNLIYVKF